MQLFQHGASYLCCQAASTTRVAALLGAPHSARGRRTRQHAGEAFLNLPGWCWARIKQLALIGSSSSLHSEACKALGGSDGVVHSTISLAAICIRAVAKDSAVTVARGDRRATCTPSGHALHGLAPLRPHTARPDPWNTVRPQLPWSTCATQRGEDRLLSALPRSYLLGLLAMIKCSICSYQCDN